MEYDINIGDSMQEQKQRKLRIDEEHTPYAICPKCHKKIYNVVLTDREYITYDASPDLEFGSGLKFEETDSDIDLDFNATFTCPECKEVIATSEEEAEALFYEAGN